MQKGSKAERLFKLKDTDKIRDEIRQLVDNLGYPATRPSDHQIKIREVNYYFGKGTITIDPCTRYKHKGFDALLDLLAEKYPKSAGIVILG